MLRCGDHSSQFGGSQLVVNDQQPFPSANSAHPNVVANANGDGTVTAFSATGDRVPLAVRMGFQVSHERLVDDEQILNALPVRRPVIQPAIGTLLIARHGYLRWVSHHCGRHFSVSHAYSKATGTSRLMVCVIVLQLFRRLCCSLSCSFSLAINRLPKGHLR